MENAEFFPGLWTLVIYREMLLTEGTVMEYSCWILRVGKEVEYFRSGMVPHQFESTQDLKKRYTWI
jgi:hypothetical protein